MGVFAYPRKKVQSRITLPKRPRFRSGFHQFPNDSPRIRFEPTPLQLQLIDHVIIGIPGAGRSFYFGFKEAGVIS
jgi:hypothetical protein